MALQKEDISEIVKAFQSKDVDTGCIEVQVALWTKRIAYLTEHFKVHKKDHHSRRGLIQLVNRRRKSLDYLKRKDFNRYKTLIKELGIRK